MFTPKRFCRFTSGSNCAFSLTQTRISSGSSETEVKELAVMPCTRPGPRSTVTTVTPVANWPSARRNSEVLGVVGGIGEVFEDTTAGRFTRPGVGRLGAQLAEDHGEK